MHWLRRLRRRRAGPDPAAGRYRRAPPVNSKPVVVDQPVGQAYRYSGGRSIPSSAAQQMVASTSSGQDLPGRGAAHGVRPAGRTTTAPRTSPWTPPAWPRSLRPHDAAGAPIAGRAAHLSRDGGGGGLWSTPSDLLAKFVIAIQRSAKGADRRGSCRSGRMTKTMLTPVRAATAWASASDGSGGRNVL
ncbi:hypothetical protein ACRAWD_20145 [Caulobacter segnis]